MPLDTPEHIRMAWDLISRRRVAAVNRAIELGRWPEGVPTHEEFNEANDRVQLAAVEHGMGML
jgi:uncharacterized protein YeaC (DUF1315 family)